MLVFSRECGALVLSPCRVRSTIEDRKHLYCWRTTSKRLHTCNSRNNFNNKLLLEAKLAPNKGFGRRLKLKNVTAESYSKLSETCCDLNRNFSSPVIDNCWKCIFSGTGGFGSVFVSVYNNRKVAIKQLHCRRYSSSLDFWTLCAELNAFRLPQSPNVAKLISFILCDPFIQIVTEFVDGRDLQRLINDDQWIIDSNNRKHIALQIINGLVHCHLHRLLHLDVKPSNILLSDDMSTCKLTDFGCSRIATEVSDGCLMARKALTTSSFGTIVFKAPELLKNGHPTDRADIYSFSILLYELLSRSEPYPDLHPHAIVFLVAGRNMRPDVNKVKCKLAKEGLRK
uniref:non-specific serine/threonine protein kinase n=1 Tax=Syphacia muris TaxID=451379 RepID=A0A0N5AZL4_9BILA